MSNNESNKYDWDLESILENSTLDDLYNKWKSKSENILSQYKNFYKTKSNFINWLKSSLEFSKLSNRLSNYISNKSNENIIDQTWIGWEQKLSHDSMILSTKMSDYINIIIENEEIIKKYLQDKKLEQYIRDFNLIFKSKKHILEKNVEKALSSISINNSSVDDIFTTLTDNDLPFDDAIDSKGKKHKLKTASDVFINLKSTDRKLRKTSWINFNESFYNFRNTLVKTLYYNYLQLNTWSKLRNYKDYIDSCVDTDEIDEKLILLIYKMVEKYRPLFEKYAKTKNKMLKKQLKLKVLEPWDKSIDLAKSPITFEIDQAKAEVLESLKPLGTQYQENIKKAFNEKWISWLPKQSKTTGAYSIGGTYGLEKMYILMNYDKTINSVSTLIHELGHSMHSYEFSKTQDVHASCSIFYAEIASIVNEVLLNLMWMDKYKNDKVMLNNVIDNMLKEFFSTTTRQIIFSNFEYDANKLINKQQPFTYESVEKLYLDMIKKYEGTDKEFESRAKKQPYKYSLATILRIGHFYVGNFYVYKYAIGQIAAILIATKIFNTDKNTIDSYYKFLQSGSSKSPLDTIKLLGIDLYDENIYNEVYKIIDSLINRFIKNNKTN